MVLLVSRECAAAQARHDHRHQKALAVVQLLDGYVAEGDISLEDFLA